MKMGYWDIDPLKLGYLSFETGIFGIPGPPPLTGPYCCALDPIDLMLPKNHLFLSKDLNVWSICFHVLNTIHDNLWL